MPPNNSLERTRLACGKLGRALPAELRENESTDTRAAGPLAHRAAHLHRTCGAPQVQVLRSSRPLGRPLGGTRGPVAGSSRMLY